MDKFVTSSNPFDHILMLIWSDDGVWISTKGSSIVELWDPQQLVCKMLYDVKSNKHPTLKKVQIWQFYDYQVQWNSLFFL